MKKFSKFLAKNGDLLDYQLKDNICTIYPRYLIAKSFSLWKPLNNYKIIFKILTRRNLSALTVQYVESEIGITINKDEYKNLDNKSFHLLCQNIIINFEQSIQFFNQEDYINSYEKLFFDAPSYIPK